MMPLQTLEIRAAEIRSRLSDLGGMTDLDDEKRAELDRLRGEYTDDDRKRAALVIAGDVPPTPLEARSGSEGREFRALLNKANVGQVFDGVLNKRSVDGATRELQDHYGLDINQIPVTLLARSHYLDGDELETRAVTPAPANVGTEQQPVVPQVFPQSAAAWLGIPSPVVGVGEHVFPVLADGATAQTPAENVATNPTEDTGAFSAEALSPSRLQTPFLYSREDRARMVSLDAALRENLGDALADGLDKAIIAGTNGLLTGTNLDNNNVSAVTTYALYREQLAYGRIDGRYAVETPDLRILMGSATYAHAAAQYRGNNDNMDALMSLREATGGVRVSAHVPAVVSNKQNSVVRLGMRSDMTAPVWMGITLVVDEFTKSAEGQIRVTAVLLYATKILRMAGFHKQQTQHS